MAATIEKAKADDPKELRKQIAALQKQAKANMPAVNVGVAVEQYDELRREMAEARHAIAVRDKQIDAALRANETARVAAEKVTEALGVISIGSLRMQQPTKERVTFPAPPKREPEAKPRDVTRNIPVNGTLPKGERITLIATAQHDGGVSREQLTVLTGYNVPAVTRTFNDCERRDTSIHRAGRSRRHTKALRHSARITSSSRPATRSCDTGLSGCPKASGACWKW